MKKTLFALFAICTVAFAQIPPVTLQKNSPSAANPNQFTANSSPLIVGNGQSVTFASGATLLMASGSTLTIASGSNLVTTDGSYANPSWITSLAWSKITGTPTLGTAAAKDIAFFQTPQTSAVGYGIANGTTIDAWGAVTPPGSQVFTSKPAHHVLASPFDGAGVPTMRALDATDIPFPTTAANSLLGNNTGGAIQAVSLNASQAKSLLAISYSDVSGLGNSAPLNVGVIAGTVAAGNDPRFSSPIYTAQGQVAYSNASNAGVPLDGNATSTRKFLSQSGNGSLANAPAWVTVSPTDLPTPTPTTLGGVFSKAAVSHFFVNQVGTDGAIGTAQPSASDLTNGVTGSGAAVLATSPTLTTPNIGSATGSVSGNAGTATILQTPRAINGVNFDGSAPITITAVSPNALTIGTHLTGTSYNGSAPVTIATDATSANTVSTIIARDGSGNFSAGTISAALSGNASTATNVAVGGITGLGTGVASALAVNVGTAGAPVVNGGALGTPSSGVATNFTGLPLTTGITGTLDVPNGGTRSSILTGVYAPVSASVQNRIHTRLAAGRPASVLHYGDSLINGSTSGSYSDYFKPAWSQLNGPSGRGYINFETNQVIGSGMLSGSSATTLVYNFNPGTAGWSSQSTGIATGNFAYSFSGIGTYVTTAAGTETFYIQDSLYPFQRVTLFYLVQPGGGTFDFGKDGQLTTVSTASATTGVASITLSIWGTTPTDNILCVKNLTGGGSFYFFGLDFETNTRGGASYKGGVGGVTTQTEASLNATAFTSYLSTLNPSLVTLCLGQNDIGSRSAGQYQTDLTTIVTRIQAWDAACPIIFEIPTSSSSLSTYQTAIQNVATATGMQIVWWKDWIGTGSTYLQGDNVHPNVQGCALLADGLLSAFSSTVTTPFSTQNPYPNPDAFASLLVTPTSDGTFTAGTTNWAASNSGTATLDTTNHWLTCTSAGTFSGVKLTNANYGGNMTTGALYYIKIGITGPGSGSIFVYDGSGNAVKQINGVGSPSGVSATGTYEYYFYAANGATFNDIRVYCSAASQTWTITSFDVRRLIVPSVVAAGAATGFTVQGGTPNAILTVAGNATVGDPTVAGAFGGFSSTGTGTFTSAATGGVQIFNTVDQVTNTEFIKNLWSGNIAYMGVDSASGANKRTMRLRNLHGGSATYIDIVTPDGTAPFINFHTGSTSPTGSPMFYQFGDSAGTVGSTSGTVSYVGVTPTYNEASGSASNTDLLINRTETAIGSGTQNLIDAQVGGVSKLAIRNTGQVVSTLATGTAPLVVASTTNVANLNASSLNGATFAAPGAIGGGTPGSVAATTLTASSNISTAGSYSIKTAPDSQSLAFLSVGGLARWAIYPTGVESGANAGSDYSINSYDDSGAGLGVSFKIKRSSGAVSMPMGGGLAVTGGVQIGTPTGGTVANSLNVAGDVYKNNTAYTNPDYVLEHWATGKIVRFADKPGAADYHGLAQLSDVEAFAKTAYHLPRFGQDAGHGLFSGSDALLASVEEGYLYLFQHDAELKSLRTRVAQLEAEAHGRDYTGPAALVIALAALGLGISNRRNLRKA